MPVAVSQNTRAARLRLYKHLSFAIRPPPNILSFHASLDERWANKRAAYRAYSYSIVFTNSPRVRSVRCSISSWARISENADLSCITALQICQPQTCHCLKLIIALRRAPALHAPPSIRPVSWCQHIVIVASSMHSIVSLAWKKKRENYDKRKLCVCFVDAQAVEWKTHTTSKISTLYHIGLFRLLCMWWSLLTYVTCACAMRLEI